MLKLTHLRLAHEPVRPAVAELRDGDGVYSAEVRDGDMVHIDLRDPLVHSVRSGPAVMVEFGPLRAGLKDLELWLPHDCPTELRELRLDSGAQLLPPEGRSGTWLHHGSSVSQCREALTPTTTWPALVAGRAGVELINLGFGGQCHLDQFVARAIRDLPVDCVSLELGINILNADSMRERTFVAAVHGFLDTVRDGHPDTPLTVISPILCPAVEQRPGPTGLDADGNFVALGDSRDAAPGRLTARRIRVLLADIVQQRRDSGDDHLHYVDGFALLGEQDAGLLVDGLHPGPAGQRVLAERLAGILPVPVAR